ncbi:MAG: CRISPR-associated CARF protein Csa3 [Candidatus Nanohalobium sp.]
MGKVLAATLWRLQPVLKTFHQNDIDRIHIFVEEEIETEEANEYKKSNLEALEKRLTVQEVTEEGEKQKVDLAELEIHKTSLNDAYEFASKAYSELKDENEVIYEVSGGKKSQAFGLLMAAERARNADKIIHWIKEKSSFHEYNIPMFDFSLDPRKTEVLELLDNGVSVSDISENMEVSRSMVYNHIEDLQERGFLDQEKNLTRKGIFCLK